MLVKRRNPFGSNCFRLEFPPWAHPNKGGSRNKRWNSNPISTGRCQLDIDNFSALSASPVHLAWLVNVLRGKGASIYMRPEEHAKYAREATEKSAATEHASEHS